MKTAALLLLLLMLTLEGLSQTRKRNDYQWDKYVLPVMDSVQKVSGDKIYYRSYCVIRKTDFMKLDSVTRRRYGLDSAQLSWIYESWKNNLLPVPEVWKKETFTGEISQVMHQPKTRIYSVSLPIFIRPDVYMIQTWMMRRCNSALSTIYIVEYKEEKARICYSVKSER